MTDVGDVQTALVDPWAILFEGRVFYARDLPLGGKQRALSVAGGSWAQLHPLSSPGHLVGLIAAFLEMSGEDFEEACDRVARSTDDVLLVMKAV